MVLKNISDGKKSLVKIGRFIINMLLLFLILKLSVKVNRYANKTQITSENILICSELVNLPEKLCYVWVSTCDVIFRKYNLPCSNQHRYTAYTYKLIARSHMRLYYSCLPEILQRTLDLVHLEDHLEQINLA